MTTGQRIETQLDELDQVKDGLIDVLEEKGATIDPDAKLNDLIGVVDSLEVNDGYRYTKFGLSPTNKTTYINYQDELNRIDFRNFGLNYLFSDARLQAIPDFSNCKNINTITSATETFRGSYFSGASTSNLTKLANLHLPSGLTSLSQTFADVTMIDLTGLSFPSIQSAVGIFRNSNTSQSAQQTNLIIAGHNEADFTNISNASYFYYNRSMTFYNTNGTLFTDTINGTTFSGNIYTLTNKTFPNLTTIKDFMYRYFGGNQKAIKIVNCNFPNLTDCSEAFSGRATTGAPADYTTGISHLYIKDCTFDKALNLTNLFYNNGGLTTIIIDCPNKIKVSNLNSAFSGVKGLIEFPADKFDVTGCSNFKYAFRSCQSLESLDLSSWVKSSGDFSSMFEYCTKLKHLDIRNIEFSKVSASNTSLLISNVPKDCEIIVKNDTEKQWFNNKWNAWTNVKTVDEYEA